MFIRELITANPAVRLISPNVARDAPLSVGWQDGPGGRHTLKMMGVMDADNRPTTLELEQQRTRDFLEKTDQYNWMIQVGEQVIGTIWVDLLPVHQLRAPSIHIMLGDPAARGAGVGLAAAEAVVGFLQSQRHAPIYSRHLLDNLASRALLHKLGFVNDGAPYAAEDDGFSWQNLVLK